MSAYMTNFLAYLRVPFVISGSAALFSAALYFKQNEVIYMRNVPPGTRVDVPRPPAVKLDNYEELNLPTPDGEILNAFLIKPLPETKEAPLTVLMFHGNAGNIGHRLPIAQVLVSSLRCNVFLLQYRGYGLSTGDPSEKGLQIDAQTGINFFTSRPDLRNSKLVIYGQSLGGAVAIYSAAKYSSRNIIQALILENTFLSMRKLIPSAFPPARYLVSLCHEIWPSDELIPKIPNIPVLFLSGQQDEIVPPFHMKQLYDLCQVDVKIWKIFPKGNHNETTDEPGYFDSIAEFIFDHILK